MTAQAMSSNATLDKLVKTIIAPLSALEKLANGITTRTQESKQTVILIYLYYDLNGIRPYLVISRISFEKVVRGGFV